MKRPDVSKRQKENNVAKRPEVRKKISKNRKGKGLGEKNANNNFEVRKKKRNSLLNYYGENPHIKREKSLYWLQRYKNEPNLKVKRRIDRINQILKNGFFISVGRNEKRILDELELSLGYKIIRQFIVKGYSIDGYIPDLNLAIEVDERHHFTYNNKLKQKDIIRQQNIMNELNCNFVRIGDI